MDNIKLIADNIKATIIGTRIFGKVELNDLGNIALFRIAREIAFKGEGPLPALSHEEKSAIRKLWSPYFVFTPTKYFRLYKKISGVFNPEFMPEDIMVLYVDRFYSDRQASKNMDNKCYYYRLFKGLNMPRLITMKVGSCWLDPEMNIIDEKKALALVRAEDEAVFKKANSSEGGMGVSFVRGCEAGENLIREYSSMDCDVVVQAPIKQHPFMAALNPSSVNTLRIISFVKDGEVIIVYSGFIRFGKPGSRIDNVGSGGSYAGVTPDGRLNGKAFNPDHTPRDILGDFGSDFEGLEVPGYDDAIRLVKEAHSRVASFRYINWDIAIDEDGRAVLVEANFSLGTVSYLQYFGEPVFGDMTEEVLAEVFGNRRRLTVLI